MNPIPCTVCGEEGHREHRCPTLCSPLKSGFYSPPAGARQGGDDDDESCKIENCTSHTCQHNKTKQCLKQNSKSVNL